MSAKATVDPKLVKEVIRQFYMEYNADKVGSIDVIVEKYVGNEIELLKNLKEKYNVAEYEPFDNVIREFAPIPVIKVEPAVINTGDATEFTPSSGQSSRLSGTFPQIGIGIKDISSMKEISTTLAGKILSQVPWRMNSTSDQIPSPDGKNVDVMDENSLLKRKNELLATIGHLEAEKSRLESVIDGLNITMQAAVVSQDAPPAADGQQTSDGPPAAPTEAPSVQLLRKIDTNNRLEQQLLLLMNSFDQTIKTSNDKNINSINDMTEISALRNLTNNLKDCLQFYMKQNRSPALNNENVTNAVMNTLNKLDVDWLEFDNLKNQNVQLQDRLEICRSAISSTEKENEQLCETVTTLKEKVSELELALQISKSNEDEMMALCDLKIENIEQMCKVQIQQARESLVLEREDAMSALSSIADTQRQWQAVISQEAQNEISRLRTELTKSRRQETQREREISYLQKQLSEAGKQLAQYIVESETADRAALDES